MQEIINAKYLAQSRCSLDTFFFFLAFFLKGALRCHLLEPVPAWEAVQNSTLRGMDSEVDTSPTSEVCCHLQAVWTCLGEPRFPHCPSFIEWIIVKIKWKTACKQFSSSVLSTNQCWPLLAVLLCIKTLQTNVSENHPKAEAPCGWLAASPWIQLSGQAC